MLQYTCCSGPGSATLGLATSSRLHHFTGKTTELDRRTHRGEFGTAARALLMAAKAKVGPDGCRGVCAVENCCRWGDSGGDSASPDSAAYVGIFCWKLEYWECPPHSDHIGRPSWCHGSGTYCSMHSSSTSYLLKRDAMHL